LRLHADVMAADIVDQLTFAHGVFTFNSAVCARSRFTHAGPH
jgi:hypothetical protein